MSLPGFHSRPQPGPRPGWTLVAALLLGLLCLGAPFQEAHAAKDDLNRDGVVDLEDLALFSEKYLHQDWETVDWCAWLESDPSHAQGRDLLVGFIREFFQCGTGPGAGDDPLAVRNSNDYPTRLALAPDGKVYVSNPKTHSVFIYDSLPGLTLVGELKGLSRPLGIAIGPDGHLYVGNRGRRNVEVYSVADGSQIARFGDGELPMPTDLIFDATGFLYVADSQDAIVRVYDPTAGTLVGSIGSGQLSFPIALEIANQELYIGDQRSGLVNVFDLQGNLLRAFGGTVGSGMMGYNWRGKFVRLESLDIDGQGRLHAGDCYTGVIQVLDPVDGTYLGVYGTQGTDPGQLNLPLDIMLDGSGGTVVANTLNRRVEFIAIPPDPLPQDPPSGN